VREWGVGCPVEQETATLVKKSCLFTLRTDMSYGPDHRKPYTPIRSKWV
jgi:hypothetical protein